MTTETITCRQLCDQGLSNHQVRFLTQNLTPISLEQGEALYNLREIIVAMRDYLSSNRLPPLHREAVNEVLISLLQQLDNVVAAPFGLARDQQIGFHIQKLLRTQSSFLQTPSHHTEPTNVVLPAKNYAEVIPLQQPGSITIDTNEQTSKNA